MMQFFEITMIIFAGGWSLSSSMSQHYSKFINAGLLNKKRELKNTALPEIKFKF
ncbi:MAG: hypothetical protein IPL55_17150 [Saprospiraceae bacterium]|nr:hypothetical protein [Saprospiraceae bacterium]MBL0023780.1 hypothetical protein [Saprospiraceae bacterium]